MIEWNDKYSVCILLIDEQHKKLFEIINKAVIANKHSKTAKDILRILDEMTEYALKHFEIEERYMKEFSFPEYLTHRKEHIDFVDTTIYYKNKVVGGNFHIINEILEYLNQWLVNHIQASDRKYIDCFQKNGLK